MIIFEEGTEVIIYNERIGIIKSDYSTSSTKGTTTNSYLVETGKNLEEVCPKDIVSAKEWSKKKLLSTCDESLLWKKMVHKETSKISLKCVSCFFFFPDLIDIFICFFSGSA